MNLSVLDFMLEAYIYLDCVVSVHIQFDLYPVLTSDVYVWFFLLESENYEP